MLRSTHRQVVAIAAIGVIGLVGCTADSGASAGDGSAGDGGGATEVAVTLQEWSVLPDVDSAPAGDVVFTITNEGPEDIHEFVIFRTDLDPDALPVDEDGVVDEEGEGITVVDEVEDLAVGATEELAVELAAGSYVLVCNIWSEDEAEAHYAMGMRTAFTVTD
jgi:uncharacterized cupredoxin-like copper-binding protein